MQADRFFTTTRGKIVTELRRRRRASAVELAALFGLSPNAIRQQLIILERDGLVVEVSVRRGPTKPTYEFSLTPEAEKLFPQRYDKMLGAVLRELREQSGPRAVQQIFDGIAQRTLAKNGARLAEKSPQGKVVELAAILRENGVDADVDLLDGSYVLHEHNCPYANVVKEHPEVCSMIHHVLNEIAPGGHEQTESIATGGDECRFVLQAAQEDASLAMKGT